MIAARNERNTRKYKLKKGFLMKWINGRLPEKTSYYDKHSLLLKRLIISFAPAFIFIFDNQFFLFDGLY